MWERELRKIKGLYDNRLRASQQKSSKMEQALTNQTYQVTIKNKSMWFFFPLFLACCLLAKLLRTEIGLAKNGSDL